MKAEKKYFGGKRVYQYDRIAFYVPSKFHKTVNSVSFGGIATGIITAFVYVSISSGKHIDGFHQIAGLTAFILASITMIAGFYQFNAKNKPAVRTAHRWLGRFSLLMFLTAITLGLKLINII